ncbi:MAG: prephenate dehydrogenase [Actinomycetota bacterium]
MDPRAPSEASDVRRVLVIGTGLVGGSIGLALRKAGGVTVVGYDVSAETTEAALGAGALDEGADDLSEAAAGADVVIVATPVGEILSTIAAVAGSARIGCVVTDVGSTKATIVSEAERLLGPDRAFVGGHPMAGTEGEGISSARPDLFDGALWILSPTKATDSNAYREINQLVTKLGARTLALDPVEHDRLVALVSHLPYAIATSLMLLAAEDADPRKFQAAAGSFRDVTRTAGSSPRLWRDIFSTNRDAVVDELDKFTAILGRLRSAVADSDWDAFDTLVGAARDARRRFPTKGERAPVDPVTVEVSISDRAGALAEVTTAVGEGGINIEDLWVEHTPAGGVLRLLVDGHETAGAAASLLESRGYRTTVVEDL